MCSAHDHVHICAHIVHPHVRTHAHTRPYICECSCLCMAVHLSTTCLNLAGATKGSGTCRYTCCKQGYTHAHKHMCATVCRPRATRRRRDCAASNAERGLLRSRLRCWSPRMRAARTHARTCTCVQAQPTPHGIAADLDAACDGCGKTGKLTDIGLACVPCDYGLCRVCAK